MWRKYPQEEEDRRGTVRQTLVYTKDDISRTDIRKPKILKQYLSYRIYGDDVGESAQSESIAMQM